MPRNKIKSTRVQAAKAMKVAMQVGELLSAAEHVAIRFPIEHKTTLSPCYCNCLQFEDHDDCRHIGLMVAIENYKA